MLIRCSIVLSKMVEIEWNMLEPVPSYYALGLVALAGIASYVAFEHFLIGFRRRDLRFEFWFAFLGLCYGGLALAIFYGLGIDVQDVGALGRQVWRQHLFHILMSVAMVGFVRSFGEACGLRLGRKIWFGAFAVMAIAIALHVVFPMGLFVAKIADASLQVLPWGEQVVSIRLVLTPFYALYNLFFVGLLVLSGYMSVRLARTGQKRRARILLGGIAVAVLALFFSLLQDAGYGLAIDPVLPSILGTLLVVNLLLTDEIVQASRLSRQVEVSEKENSLLADSLDQKKLEADTLLAVISQDLRTPLMNIQGFAQELTKSLDQCEELLAARLPDSN